MPRITIESDKTWNMKEGDHLQEVRRQVDMFFDHALSLDDEQSLLQRVQRDPVYQQVFSHEKTMRELIRNHVHRPGVTPDFIQSIKNHIKTE